MTEEKIECWHFAKADNKLNYGDDREIVIGEVHSVECTPLLCAFGLHGSKRIIDAIQYAPGPMIYRVEIWGGVDIGNDKLCGTHRNYLWGFDASDILFEFSRKQALINIEKIKPYTNKKDYALITRWLATGDKGIRSAAAEAAVSAVVSAAEVAEWSAEWSATVSAAVSAARSAARSAELSSAEAARSAEWSAAEAARSAAWSAELSARSAAVSAAVLEQNKMLEEMVYAEAKKRGFIQ